MIEFQNIYAGYGKREILHGVNLSVPAGQVTTLIGSNGSGKSTLLRALLGLVPKSGGDILYDGVSMEGMSAAEVARKIAYLPQGKNMPDISAGRMALHGRFPYLHYPRKYREQDFIIAQEAMRQMGILELAHKQMAELSGGMRQKVYIAMALTQQAPVIVMDEPTTKQLAQSGKTVLLVLHDILLAFRISHRIAAMQYGKILQCGTSEEMLASNIADRLYGVSVKAVWTDAGLQYYYEMNEE